jgi:hypothetical protein
MGSTPEAGMIRRSTIILLVVFVLAVGFAVIFQNSPLSKKQTTTTPTVQPALLANWPEAKISHIQITGNQEASFDLVRNPDQTWAFSSPQGRMVDQGKMEQFLAYLLDLQSQSNMDSTLSMSFLGLDSPNQIISIFDSAGVKQTVKIGKVTPIGTGYYVQLDNNQPIVVDKTAVDYMLELAKIDSLIIITPIPSLVSTVTPVPTN